MQNEPLKEPFEARVKNAIDLYFIRGKNPAVATLVSSLQKENIQLVLRQNEQGIIYGATYVDHRSKGVFNGSDWDNQEQARS